MEQGFEESKDVSPESFRPVGFDPIAFRIEGITDRDAPSLYESVGERDLFTLWTEKVEFTDSTPEDMPNLFEVQALRLFVERHFPEIELRCHCFAQSPAIPFIRAIIDGVSFEEELLVRAVAQSAEDFAKVEDITLPLRGGRVPERHWVEIQHQLAATNLGEGYFVSTVNGSQIHISLVTADPVFRSNHLAECILFWDYVRRAELPPNANAPEEIDPAAEEKATTFAQPELTAPSSPGTLTGDEEHGGAL